jgi:hypothetical protein
MQNILLIWNIHDTHIGNIISCKPCKEKLKKVLGIKTRLIGKTEIQNINQLIDDWEKENARKKILIEKLIYMGRHPWGLEDEIVKSIENIKKNNNDINYQNSNWNTTLILAARHWNKDIVKLLLKHPDININRRDSDGYTAQGWAIKKGYNAIANLIKKHSKSK